MKNNFATYLLCSAVLVTAGTTACQQTANTNTNPGSAGNATSATPVGGNDQPASATPPTAPAMPVAATATPVATTAAPVVDSTTTGADKSAQRPVGTRAPKLLQPQIGSGGNDFYLFTQARAALNADVELKQAALTIAVHNGVVTLSGTVLNDGQKQQATRLAQGVKGVKSVDNELRVTTGGAK